MYSLTEKQQHGFALVSVISILSLCVLIALGMLSLADTTHVTQSHSKHREQAMANARLALSHALAALQAELGPDQRISVSADLIQGEEPSSEIVHPKWVGVLDASDAVDENGVSISGNKEKRFRRWLVSGSCSNTPIKLAKTKLEDPVTLLGSSTLGAALSESEHEINSQLEVEAGKEQVGPNGALAWWVSDESVKARINLGHSNKNASMVSQLSSNVVAPQLGVHSVEAFSELSHDFEAINKTVSKDTAQLHKGVDRSAIRRHWHDYTVDSLSLLTNVKNGGLKKDLSLLFSNDVSALPEEFLYSFTYGHPRVTENNWLKDNFFVDDGPRWSYLHDYVNLYKEVKEKQGFPIIDHRVGIGKGFPDDGDSFYRQRSARYQKKHSLMPVTVKVQDLFSLRTVKEDGLYRLDVINTPIVTLWNPYPIALKVSKLTYRTYARPLLFNFKANGKEFTKHHMDLMPHHTMWMFFQPTELILQPGEVVVCTKIGGETDASNWSSNTTKKISIRKGWHDSKGFYNSDNGILGSGPLEVELSLDDQSHYEQPWSWAGKRINSVFSSVYAKGVDTPWAFESWFEIAKVSSNNLLQVEGYPDNSLSFENLENNPVDLCVFTVQHKSTNPGVSKFLSMPWIHGNPVAHDSHMLVYEKNEGGDLEELELYQNRSEIKVTYPNAVDLIQVDARDDISGFFGTGNNAGDGISRLIHQQVPLRPLVSLGELQHANFISTGWAPFMCRAVGNSYAHPLIKRNSIREEAYKTLTGTEELDHSYHLNSLFFDSWYFSTLSSRESEYLKSLSEEVSLGQVVEQFASSGKLCNTRLVPSPYPSSPSMIRRDVFEDGEAPCSKAFEKISRHIAVAGGFNVNSTSVEAWKMLLSSLNGVSQTFVETKDSLFDGQGGLDSLSIQSTDPQLNPISRFSLSLRDSDEKFHIKKRCNRWHAPVELSDTQLHELAVNIVQQVKLRGPFLHLSEFVNRQVGADNGDLSLKGALQAAIDSTSINDSILSMGIKIGPDNIPEGVYDYREAAYGNTAKGAPGFLMQADILTPLAPLLTVRGDTFVVRAYGESRDGENIAAQAWCEATVQRQVNYVDPTDKPEGVPSLQVNKKFGRIFKIQTFRWLNAHEV